MAKSVLNLDEINLLKHSEEPKNQNLYGNLYNVLNQINPKKAVSLDQLYGLDRLGIAAITHNKKTLFDTVIKEWYTESVSEEDPSKKVRCSLCNTPNKYLFYIRNRKNRTLLNVGSSCITKFPGLEKYTEHQKQLLQMKKNQSIINRRNKFYNYFPNYEKYISDADKYFNSLPILLPYEIYTKLEETIIRMRKISSAYINEGKAPYSSTMNPFQLYALAIEQYVKLKEQANKHVSEYLNNPLACRRKEIDWLITTNRRAVLDRIASNNGIYSLDTLKLMTSIDFISKYTNLINSKNKSKLFKLIRFIDSGILVSFNKIGYHPPIIFSIPFSDFMKNVGASCIINKEFYYTDEDIFNMAQIRITKNNLSSVLSYIYDTINRFGYAFLFDDTVGKLILYRKKDRAIRIFKYEDFLVAYSKHMMFSDGKIEKFLSSIINRRGTSWTNVEQQEKQGIIDKVSNMYKEYKDNYFI